MYCWPPTVLLLLLLLFRMFFFLFFFLLFVKIWKHTVGQVLIASSLKLSTLDKKKKKIRRHTEIFSYFSHIFFFFFFFFFFSVSCNCLMWRQFARKYQIMFSGKSRKIITDLSSTE